MTKNGPMILLPRVNMPQNDLIMWAKSHNPPSVIWESFKDTFDELYGEGQRGQPEMGGDRPPRPYGRSGPTLIIPTIRKCIAYARQQRRRRLVSTQGRQMARWAAKARRPDLLVIVATGIFG